MYPLTTFAAIAGSILMAGFARRHRVARRSRARLGHESGQALVEFALSLPFLMIILTAILQFGLMYYKYETLTDAVRAGARELALQRGVNDPCDPALTQTIDSASNVGLTASQVRMTFAGTAANADTTTFTDTCGTGTYPTRTSGSETQGDTATVSATYAYNFSVFGVGLFTTPLSATATDEIE